MLYIGCHLSTAGGFMGMGKTALSLGANTFQFFTRNPRGGASKDYEEADTEAFRAFSKEHGFGPLVAHAPYTLNACGSEVRVRDFARLAMSEDLKRLEMVPGNYYNFHPGSHVGQGTAEGIRLIVSLLNDVLWSEQQTMVLLETMAGKGSEVGASFEEIREIIDGVNLKDKIGVCLDTCHVHDGGYDIVEHQDDVLAQFDEIIGLKNLKAVHVNDSMNPCGAHKDRHQCIGLGHIGLEALRAFVHRPELSSLPFVLETPNDLPGYAREIAMLR